VAKGDCTTCGMANCDDEYHPYALCLLVKARGGNTVAARKDMASIIENARSEDHWTATRVDNLMRATVPSYGEKG
jgi:hypothetical protein